MSGWQDTGEFLLDPLGWAQPERLASMLAPGLRPDTVERLRHSPRLRTRTSSLLAAHLGAGETEPLVTEDAVLALAPQEAFPQVAAAAGAIWHAPRVRGLVLARDVTAFVTVHGEAARAAALRHYALAPPSREEQGSLNTEIARDGAACLAAWVEALPAWAAARVRLKWAPAGIGAVDRALRARAVAVVQAAAALVCKP